MTTLQNGTPFWERPCASKGLTSYRYLGKFGWIMIGATDTADAIREANRSLETPSAEIGRLEVWNGSRYVPVN